MRNQTGKTEPIVISPEVRAYLRQMGRLGGIQRAANMTQKERIESGRFAARARWKCGEEAADVAGSPITERREG